MDSGGKDAAGDAALGDATADAAADATDAALTDADAGGDAAVEGACTAKSATNLLVDPGLDLGDASAWLPFSNIAVSIDPSDALGCATSGSLAVKNLNDAGINSGAYQCVSVTEGTTYDYGAHVYMVPPDAGPTGQVFLQLDWSASPGCTGGLLAFAQISAAGPTGAWQSVAGTAVAPAGAKSGKLYLQIIQGTGSGFRPLFDRMYITPSPGLY